MPLKQRLFLGICQISRYHLPHHFIDRNFWRPAEFFFVFAWVAEQCLDHGGAQVAGVDADDGGFLDCRAALAMTIRPVTHFVDACAFPAQLHAQGGGGVARHWL